METKLHRYAYRHPHTGKYFTVFGWDFAWMGESCLVAFPNQFINQKNALEWMCGQGFEPERVKVKRSHDGFFKPT